MFQLSEVQEVGLYNVYQMPLCSNNSHSLSFCQSTKFLTCYSSYFFITQLKLQTSCSQIEAYVAELPWKPFSLLYHT